MIMDLKPYPEYKDSGVPWLGDIPEQWKVRRLRDSVEGCFTGIWGNEPDGINDLLCIRVADFDRHLLRVKLSKPTYRSIPPSDNNQRMLKKGDLLLEKSGGGELHPVGAIILYDHDAPAVCSNFVARMPVAVGFDPNYLCYLHAHLYNIRLNVRSIKQTTGIQNLDISSYLCETAAFPSYDEQKVIVRFLNHADWLIRRYISAKQKLIKLLNEQKKAIIQQAVTRGLDPNVRLKPSGVEWLGDIPEHWGVARSRRLFTLRKELAHPDDVQLSATQAYGVIPQAEFEQRVGRRVVKITMHLEKRKHVEKDDFVISMRSFEGGLERAWASGAIRSSYVILKPESGVDVSFFSYLFKSVGYIRALQATANFIRDGQDLTYENFRSVDLPLVPIDEQRAIANYISNETSRIDANISRLNREIELLREYQTRLIADVVTGKLDVREAAAQLPESSGKPESLELEELTDEDSQVEEQEVIEEGAA